MAEIITSAPTNGNSSSANSPSSEVYAVFGAEPEVQAYAMAKYSRSALSMKESLKEISAQIGAPSTPYFRIMNRFPKKCSAIWRRSHPSPRR